VGGGPGWPEDTRPWLGDVPPPGAPGSTLDADTGARIVAAVRAAYGAGLVRGRMEGMQAASDRVRQLVRDEVVAPLSVVISFLETVQAELPPTVRSVDRLRSAVRRIQEGGRGRTLRESSSGTPPPPSAPPQPGPGGRASGAASSAGRSPRRTRRATMD